MTEINEQIDSDELIQLGGNIQLSGFNNMEKLNNIVINKIIGNYVKKFRDHSEGFENLHLRLKPVHGSNKKVELHAKAINHGKILTSEIIDMNLYVALDKVLKKIQAEMERN